MSDLFDENNENKIPENRNVNGFVSLQKETEQPEDESEVRFRTSASDETDNNDRIEKKIENIEAAVNAEYENTLNETEIKSPYEKTAEEQNADVLPKTDARYGESSDSRNAVDDYAGTAVNPYRSDSQQVQYQRNGNAAVYAQPPKAKISSGLKAYLIIITGLTVIFLVGFILECMHTYSENGVFGGDLDRFIDLDTDYGYNFGFGGFFDDDPDEDSSESDDSDDISGGYDFIDNNDSDNEPSQLKEAPDRSTVVNKDAANITVADQPDDIDAPKYTAKDAFKRVENSVVNVVVYDGEIGNEDLALGSGTGIIISEDGYIVTNSHVLNDSGEYSVEIILSDESSYAAAIVGYDSRTDLAVVKIDADGLKPVEFVNSDQIEVGQDAIAVGNPGGTAYTNSLTKGCVSALNRTVASNRLVSYIQTDAAINPGNSGGPLLNSAGQVMGITTIKISNTDYEGMGFAIPSNTTVEIVNDLIGQGYVSDRVRLGITGTVSYGDFLSDIPEGIVISEIADDSPLKETDAQVNDIITAIDGQKVGDFSELFSVMANYQPGDEAVISIYRPATSSSTSKSFDVKITFVADNGETQRH